MFVHSDVSYTHINSDIDLKILRVKQRYQLTVIMHFSATILSWQLHVYTAISRKVVGKKMCTRQSRKVIWDMINTLFLTTVAVEPTFVAFL